MHDFTYHNTTKIIFGKDTWDAVGIEAAKYGKALLIFGGGSVKDNGVYGKTVSSLEKSGVPFAEIWGVKPNPRIEKVREAAETARKEKVSLIIAVGGGSVIDTAKAAAAAVFYEGDPWDFYCGKAKPEKALPIGAVLTIPAAGSESSKTSVISNTDTKQKVGCTAECFLPSFAVLNPENTYTLPPYQTACGAADMMAHMLERYFVTTPCCDLTDRMIEGGLQTVMKFAPIAIAEPNNYDARAELMMAGYIAHCDLLDRGRGEKGRGGDWASHQLEHQLSAYYDIAHGAGLAVIFPAWMKFAAEKRPEKLVQLSERLFGITGDNAVSEMISRLESFFRSLGLPVRLSEIGIGNENFAAMSEAAVKAKGNNLGKYIHLEVPDVMNIYSLAEK